MTVLIVESSSTLGEVMKTALKECYPTVNFLLVQTVGTALDCLFATGQYTELGAVTPSLIMLSLDMPGIGALEMLRIIKSYERLKKIPVVMLASSCEDVRMDTCYKMGVASCIWVSSHQEQLKIRVCEGIRYWLDNVRLLPQFESRDDNSIAS